MCEALLALVHSIGQVDRIQDPQVSASEDGYPWAYCHVPIYDRMVDKGQPSGHTRYLLNRALTFPGLLAFDRC